MTFEDVKKACFPRNNSAYGAPICRRFCGHSPDLNRYVPEIKDDVDWLTYTAWNYRKKWNPK